jgi:hypothetical protein
MSTFEMNKRQRLVRVNRRRRKTPFKWWEGRHDPNKTQGDINALLSNKQNLSLKRHRATSTLNTFAFSNYPPGDPDV